MRKIFFVEILYLLKCGKFVFCRKLFLIIKMNYINTENDIFEFQKHFLNTSYFLYLTASGLQKSKRIFIASLNLNNEM
jgi:hypothetical protein